MKTILELHTEREELRVASMAVLSKSKADKAAITDDQRTTLEANAERIKAIDVDVDKQERDGKNAAFFDELGNPDPPAAPDPDGGARGAADRSDPGQLTEQRIRIPAQAKWRKTKRFGSNEDAYAYGRFLLGYAIDKPHEASRKWCRDHGIIPERRAMGEAVNTAGGYLVPDIFLPIYIRLLEERGVARRIMDVNVMSSDTELLAIENSGVASFWVNEQAQITLRDLGLAQASVTAKKIACITALSTEIGEDAMISVADKVIQSQAYNTADKEDEAALNGDGTSTFGGFTGITEKIDDGTHTASIVTGALSTAAGVLITELLEMWGALPTFVRNPVWVMHKVWWANVLARLADVAGGATMAEKVAGTAVQPTFMSAPVIFAQVMNKTISAETDTIKMLLGDFGQAGMMGIRRNLQVAQSEHVFFQNDQIAIRTTSRVGFNWHSLGDNTDAGPVIAFKTSS